MNPEHFSKVVDGAITIGKVTVGGVRGFDSYIRIALEDELSSLQFLELEMGLAEFTQALTGSGGIPVKIGLRGLERIGLKHEVKTENIQVTGWGKDLTEDQISVYLHPFEIDGWKANRLQFANHNRIAFSMDGNYNTYCVHFHRWVEEA